MLKICPPISTPKELNHPPSLLSLLKQRAHHHLPHGRSGVSRSRAFALAPGAGRAVGLAEAVDPLLPAAQGYIHHQPPGRLVPGLKVDEAQGVDELLGGS